MAKIIPYNNHYPQIADTAVLFSGAKIIGDVILDADVNIWFNAILRGDTERIHIHAGTNIQDNVVIHGDHKHQVIIKENVTVGHSAIVHGAKIGAGSLIGMGAILLNGATVGSNCLVAAGAVCLPESHFEDNTLIVGNPAKAIKVMNTSQIEGMHQNTAYYIKLSKSYFEQENEI